MRAMHYAVDSLNLDNIFPTSSGSVTTTDNPSALKKCLDELKGSELNKAQQDAITSMLDPACRQVIKIRSFMYMYIYKYACTCIE